VHEKLAYKDAYATWLRLNKLQASDENWAKFKDGHYGRFVKCPRNVPVMQSDNTYEPCGH
jgi:hypothetical protein